MKIFIDTANIEEIKQACTLGIIDGVTTNPSLIAKENRPYEDVLKEISSIIQGPLSAEVIGQDSLSMINEARHLSKIAKNIVVKIPLTKEGLKAVFVLKKEKIKTNVTLCFSASQALLVAKLGAEYVSPFIGRLDDISQDGMNLIRDIKTIFCNYRYDTEIIVASVRHPMHIVESAKIGAHIVTVPFMVIEQLIKHPLTDVGVLRFLQDYKKIPQKTINNP